MNPSLGEAGGLGAQSFRAKLNYIRPNSGKHSNKIHITVEIPHQDGMLPLLSTMPIHNIEFLLSHNTYRQQHLCSNLLNTTESQSRGMDVSFLDINSRSFEHLNSERHEQAARLYAHLNRMTCRWTFEAYYDMTEIVNSCGGRVMHNFDVDTSSQSYVTVFQPFYVSYLYAKAPSGWVSLDHQTELEFSFYYETVQFQSALDVRDEPKGEVEVIRLGIGEDGKLSIQFRTRALFRG